MKSGLWIGFWSTPQIVPLDMMDLHRVYIAIRIAKRFLLQTPFELKSRRQNSFQVGPLDQPTLAELNLHYTDNSIWNFELIAASFRVSRRGGVWGKGEGGSSKLNFDTDWTWEHLIAICLTY